MLDFNHNAGGITPSINHLIDVALEADERSKTPRNYLGASRLGVACERALQFEYTHTPKDPGQDFDGQLLRIFAAGHLFEDMAIKGLRMAGFELSPPKEINQTVSSSDLKPPMAASKDMWTAFSLVDQKASQWVSQLYGNVNPSTIGPGRIPSSAVLPFPSRCMPHRLLSTKPIWSLMYRAFQPILRCSQPSTRIPLNCIMNWSRLIPLWRRKCLTGPCA